MFYIFREGSTAEEPDEDNSDSVQNSHNGETREIDAMDNGTAPVPEGDVDEDHHQHLHSHDSHQVGGTDESSSYAWRIGEAPVSERAASTGFISENPAHGSPRVQFEKIREEGVVTPQPEDYFSDEEKNRRRHHHKHDHK